MGITAVPPADYREETRLLLLLDLAGWTQLAGGLALPRAAELLNTLYIAFHAAIDAAQGKVVKVMGDGCLAIFPPDAAPLLIETVLPELARDIQAWGQDTGLLLRIGANLHRGPVALARFGPEAHAQPDVIGPTVNHLFRMAAGAGLRVSLPVWESLPDTLRNASGWEHLDNKLHTRPFALTSP